MDDILKDILRRYKEVETKRISVANKIEKFGDKYIPEFNRLTDKLEKLDLEYQKTYKLLN